MKATDAKTTKLTKRELNVLTAIKDRGTVDPEILRKHLPYSKKVFYWVWGKIVAQGLNVWEPNVNSETPPEPTKPTSKAAIKETIVKEIEKCEAVLEAKGYAPLTYKTRFDIRAIGLAGKASYYKNNTGFELNFNVKMAEANKEEFINNTPAHELAHLYNKMYNDGKGHDSGWKKFMLLLGKEPKRLHNMKAAPSQLKNRFEYKCGCSTHHLTSVRHNRIRKGLAFYSCGKCHQRLVAVVKESKMQIIKREAEAKKNWNKN